MPSSSDAVQSSVLEVFDIDVILPTKEERKRLAAYSSKKPMARVLLSVSNGGVREIVVPARVGRVLLADPISVPCDENEAFDQIHELEFRSCCSLITDLLSHRDYSSGELTRKLLLYGFRDVEIQRAVDRAHDRRYLDDRRFAVNFIQERIRRGWGQRKIEAELKRRGVECSEIDGYPEAFFTEESDLERASQILERRVVPDDRAREKLTRFLLTRGFPYRIANEAVLDRLSEDLS